jgi:hypothetical protein
MPHEKYVHNPYNYAIGGHYLFPSLPNVFGREWSVEDQKAYEEDYRKALEMPMHNRQLRDEKEELRFYRERRNSFTLPQVTLIGWELTIEPQ